MRTIVSALAIAWTMSGILRAIAGLLIDRHWSHGLHALSLYGLADAFLEPRFLAAAATGAFAATALGSLAARVSKSALVPTAIATTLFWAVVGWHELTSRTAVWDVMTQQLTITSIHLAVVATVGFGFVLTAFIALRHAEASPTGPLTIAAILGAAALGARVAAASLAAAPIGAPNFLLISIDTLRADHLGSYGYSRDTSPRLDELAAAGVLYEESISQAPNTHPSMASMLTSRYPSRLGGKAFKYIHYSLPTIAEVLRNSGYDTAAIVSNVWLKKEMGFDAGFAHFDETSAMSEFYAEQDRIDWKEAAHVTDAALELLASRSNRPFFLWLHYLDPHHPYDPPAPFDTRFSGSAHEHREFLSELSALRTREQTQRLVKMGSGEEPVTDAEFQAIVDQYDGEIAYADMQIGRVLDELDRMGIADSTTVIVTSDHGEEFRDHAGWGHSHTLHRELLHVPLIIRYARSSQVPDSSAEAPLRGIRVGQRVRTLDIAPTIATAAGRPVPDVMEGRDLRSLAQHDRVAISMLTRKHWTSIAMDSWKLITRAGGADRPVSASDDDSSPVELYDLREDLFEHRNVADEHGDTVARLNAALEEHVGRNAAAETISKTAEQLDPATRKQLEALGYID